MVNLNKMTPAPWFTDGYRIYGPTRAKDKRDGAVLMDAKQYEAQPEDLAFIVLVRNSYELIFKAMAMLKTELRS